MKGYVKVSVAQIQESIQGFTKRFNEGKKLRDEGIERFYKRFYLEEGSWWLKWRCRNMTSSQFVYKHMGCWNRIGDVLFRVLTKEECEILDFWQWHHMSALDGPKAMVSQSVDGFALVDSEMATAIQTYRGYL